MERRPTMNHPHRFTASLLTLVAALALATSPHLARAESDDGEGLVPPYVSAAQLDLVTLLPPPPAAGSLADRQDVAAVIAAQRQASSQRIALARHDAKESVYTMFGALLGAHFNARELPLTDHLFARLGESEAATADPVKTIFRRPRPYLAVPGRIKALVEPSHSFSYPSGHSTRVTLEGNVLAQILPERRAAIWARIREYEHSRVVGGMHYPSDIEAGTLAGTAVAARVSLDPQFQQDFAAARQELRAALALPPAAP